MIFWVMSACFRSLIGTDDVSILWKGEMIAVLVNLTKFKDVFIILRCVKG